VPPSWQPVDWIVTTLGSAFFAIPATEVGDRLRSLGFTPAETVVGPLSELWAAQ
jgi:hypothetical protein